MQVEIVRRFTFEAAHRLPRVPAGHQCSRIHGHTYRVEVGIRAGLNEQMGWVVDFGSVSQYCEEVVRSQLDHQYLNEIDGLQNPTVENLCFWVLRRMAGAPFPVSWIRIHETDRSSAQVWARGAETCGS